MSYTQQPPRVNQPPSQNQRLRRDTVQSSSSSQSTAGSSRGGERGSSESSAQRPAVESAVTRLLVAIKQLLEALTSWSTLEITETDVSDLYVRLGNDFNSAVAAFAAFGIDMSELMSVPDDLRIVLEQCLAEDATPENLGIYLPTVRQIITNLLQGLRGKQSTYRQIVSNTRHRSSEQSGHGRPESRSSRSSRREGGHRSQLSRTATENGHPENAPKRSDRLQESTSSNPPVPGNDDHFVGGFVAPNTTEAFPSDPRGASDGLSESSQPRKSPTASQSYPRSNLTTDNHIHAASSPITTNGTDEQYSYPQSPPQVQSTLAQPQVPPTVKRYSLVDRPTIPPAVVIEATNDSSEHNLFGSPMGTPSPDTPSIDPMQLQAPAVANSLAALKSSEALERRASKRFSTYNISKMTGGSTLRERSLKSNTNQSNRRSLAAGGALSPGDLAVLTEADEDEASPTSRARRDASSSSRRTASRTPTPLLEEEEVPPVPPLPPSASPEPDATAPVDKSKQRLVIEKSESVSEEAPRSFPVFLQLGREVKKVVIEPGLSFSSLRVLFVDKFSYNPGLENFPAIYIRDPSSGVQYELEDTDEVKEKCLLSLNIEPLDQIKQHIDTQIATLSQDIKELRAVTVGSRHSLHLQPIPFAESTPPAARPSDRQFAHVARRLSRMIGSDGATSPVILPQMTGISLQSQTTGGSILSEYSSRVVTDLKTQFDEVQNLRRDLGIIRQLYTEFMKTTKESLGNLRTQTQSVKQLASTNVGGARAYIDSGKTKLDMRSQDVLTRVEELQDLVEGVKDDVLKRHVTPKPQLLKKIKNDVETVAAELQSLKEHIKTIKPMWKKTWEEELQNIVEEQHFLIHQEEFLTDLLEDQKAVVDVWGHVEKVISLRASGSGRSLKSRAFRPPPLEEGHNGLSTVMLEIRSAAIDPKRRMEAIDENNKMRKMGLAGGSEFQAELAGFVGGKKLRMTGGPEEAERRRQRHNDITLKSMFSSTPGSSVRSLSPLPGIGPPIQSPEPSS